MAQKKNTMNEVAKSIINNSKVYSFFIDLYFRWLDEREYEDVKDYITAMKRSISELGLSIGRFSHKPQDNMDFAFNITCADGTVLMMPKVYPNGDVSLVFYNIKK